VGQQQVAEKTSSGDSQTPSGHGRPSPEAEERLGQFFSERPAAEADESVTKWLKRGLPIAAVVLVIVVVLWPILNDTGTSITLSYEAVQRHGEQIRMVGAKYTGTDIKDRPFELSADLAVQEGPKAEKVTLEGVRASLDTGERGKVTVAGKSGVYRPKAERLVVEGGIELASDTGYVLSAEAAEVDLKTGTGRSATPVSGSAPFGSFSANSFEINVRDRLLKLEGGVRVRLNPGELDNVDASAGEAME